MISESAFEIFFYCVFIALVLFALIIGIPAIQRLIKIFSGKKGKDSFND